MADSGDNAFFVEMQGEFLTETAFMFEQYEESMLGLENGRNPQEDLGQIFRVAHSIKGGAAAVGFSDLSKFAHIVEDLLALLRGNPEFVSSTIISLLLKSGDVLKNRIHSLQKGENLPWSTSELEIELKAATVGIEMKLGIASTSHESEMTESNSQTSTVSNPEPQEDHTNHELLAELAAQFGADSIQEPTPVATPAPAPTVNAVAATAVAKNQSGAASKPMNSSIKVDTARIDSVLDAVGELVVLKNQIVHDESIRSGGNARLAGIVDQLDKTVRELYEKTLSIRMTPLKSMFVKIQRIVRDVSLELNKPVELKLSGEETEVERTVFELLGDPLVHLVRNAMDHGIEKPEGRSAAGKPAMASLIVSAKQTGGSVTIEIIDDGGGISRDKVLMKAMEKDLVPSHINPDHLTDEQVFQFIFAPGFSTAEKVTDLSGRGVGLDVVRSNLDKINGKIDIKSKAGVGTTFRLSIPLSTAITDGIVVAIHGSKFILPIYAIREIIRAEPKDYTLISGAGRVAKIRNVLLPVIDIQQTLGKINWDQLSNMKYQAAKDEGSLRSQRNETTLVIIESIYGMMALPVDEVIGQAQVVVKPVTMGQNIPEIAGAAILGDGRTVLILDPTALTHQRTSDLSTEENGKAA